MAEPGSKPRQRISTACLGCRDKKTKCDGNPVQCSACSYREQECVYHFTENKRKPPSKNYVKALEARIATLEKQLARATAPAQNPGASQTIPNLLSEPLDLIPHARPLEVSSSNPIDEIVDIIGKFQIADGGEVRYFGSRSNLNLLQTAMLSQKSSRDIQIEGFKAATTQLKALDVSEELQSHLFGLFWRWQNQWQYFVSRRLFTSSVAAHGADKFGRFHSPLLVTAIYALASRYSDRPELRNAQGDPNTAGDQFLARIKIMLQHEIEAPTTTTVQAVLILSLCETARDKEALGFIYCGMATRMALNLGLHVDCSHCIADGLLTAEEVEHRQVTWWGVYMLDKLFNIGLGRPSMIQERDITAKMPSLDSEDEFTIWDNGSGELEPMSCRCVSVATYTRHMFTEVTEVLDSIYSPDQSMGADERAESASRAHVRLALFYSSLPSQLRLPKSPSVGNITVLPHVYQLHLQYHVVTILLHRPFLQGTQLFDGNVSGGLRDDDSHTEACRNAADAIANILRWQKKTHGLRTAVISTVHCAFTAAVVFLVDASANGETRRDRSLKGLGVCVESLKDMETAWAWSTRALVALRNIAQAWKIRCPVFSNARDQDAAPHDVSQESATPLNLSTAQGIHGNDMFSWFPNSGSSYFYEQLDPTASSTYFDATSAETQEAESTGLHFFQ